MKTQAIDTNPKTEAVLISLLQKATPAQKMSQVRSLTQTVIHLSKRAIARANKDIDAQEVDLRFVELHYGKELADRVRAYLEKVKHEKI